MANVDGTTDTFNTNANSEWAPPQRGLPQTFMRLSNVPTAGAPVTIGTFLRHEDSNRPPYRS